MDFFTRLEKIDGAINRGYERWRRWLWGALLSPVLIYAGWVVWTAIWGPPAGGVALIIHSKLDRPIRGFSVNGVAGGNASAHDPNHRYTSESGGATTCCGTIKGKTAEVVWTVDYTRAQYNAGLRTEIHKVIIPMPERQRGENDLHVHFLPGDTVLLGWSDNAWSPYDKRNPKHRSAEGRKDK